MSLFVPKPSSLVWYSLPLLGFKTANLIDGGSYVGCLPTLVETAKSAGANLPESNGKIPFQSRLATPDGVDNPTDDAEIFAIDPHGAELIRRTHIEIYAGEPSDRSEPRLLKGKP